MRAQGQWPGAAGTAQVIVDAATRLFHDRGYHGTSIRDIAREADVGIATLFHHHGSKVELLRGIIDDDLGDLLDQMEGAVAAAGDDPVERLGEGVRAYTRHHCEHPLESAIAASELRNLTPPARRRLAYTRERVHHLLESALADGIASGAFGCDRPRETAHALEAMCVAVADSARMTPPEVEDLSAGMALRLAGANGLEPAR
jgi:AcrR family transcriptional regulator